MRAERLDEMIEAMLILMARKVNGCAFKIVRKSDGKRMTYAKDLNAAHMIAEIERWNIGEMVYDETK